LVIWKRTEHVVWNLPFGSKRPSFHFIHAFSQKKESLSTVGKKITSTTAAK